MKSHKTQGNSRDANNNNNSQDKNSASQPANSRLNSSNTSIQASLVSVKQEPTENTYSIADKNALIKQISKIIKEKRRGSNAQDNCAHVAHYSILALDNLIQGKAPPDDEILTEASTAATTTNITCEYVPIKREDNQKIAKQLWARSATAVRNPTGLYSTLPNKVTYMQDLTGDKAKETALIEIEADTIPKKRVNVKLINDELMREAAKRGCAIIGHVGLARPGRPDKVGHTIAFCATATGVFYVDGQLYDGINDKGDPIFFNLNEIYTFITQSSKDINNEFIEDVFYVVHREAKPNQSQAVMLNEDGDQLNETVGNSGDTTENDEKTDEEKHSKKKRRKPDNDNIESRFVPVLQDDCSETTATKVSEKHKKRKKSKKNSMQVTSAITHPEIINAADNISPTLLQEEQDDLTIEFESHVVKQERDANNDIKITILSNETNADGTFIIFDPEKHAGKPIKEISYNAFQQNKKVNKRITVLANELNEDGIYVKFDSQKDVGKPTIEISKAEFQSKLKLLTKKMKAKRQKIDDKKLVTILLGEKNTDGSYILFNPKIHPGKATIQVTKSAYKTKKHNSQLITILAEEQNEDGTFILFDLTKHGDKPTKQIDKFNFIKNKEQYTFVTILANERNNDRTYILYDPIKHAGKPTRQIIKRTFDHHQWRYKQVTVLDQLNDDGTYILYNSKLHQGCRTKTILASEYKIKMSSKNQNLSSISTKTTEITQANESTKNPINHMVSQQTMAANVLTHSSHSTNAQSQGFIRPTPTTTLPWVSSAATISTSVPNSSDKTNLVSNFMKDIESFLVNCTNEQELFYFRHFNIMQNGTCPVQSYLENLSETQLVSAIENLLKIQKPITNVFLDINQSNNLPHIIIEGMPLLVWYLIGESLSDEALRARIEIVMIAFSQRVENSSREGIFKHLKETLKWAATNVSEKHVPNCTNAIKVLNEYMTIERNTNDSASTQKLAMNPSSVSNDNQIVSTFIPSSPAMLPEQNLSESELDTDTEEEQAENKAASNKRPRREGNKMKLLVLSNEINADGTWIKFDPAIHTGKSTREILYGTFCQHNLRCLQKITVLSNERNHNGTYIRYQPDKHLGKPTEQITQWEYRKTKQEKDSLKTDKGARTTPASSENINSDTETNQNTNIKLRKPEEKHKTGKKYVTVLEKKRGKGGVYIKYDPEKHPGEKTKQILKKNYKCRKLVTVLANEKDENDNLILYNQKRHAGKPTKEITRGAFLMVNCQKSNSIAIDERKAKLTYKFEDTSSSSESSDSSHSEEEKRQRDPQRVLILLDKKNEDGTYILYNSKKHPGQATKEVTQNAYYSNKSKYRSRLPESTTIATNTSSQNVSHQNETSPPLQSEQNENASKKMTTKDANEFCSYSRLSSTPQQTPAPSLQKTDNKDSPSQLFTNSTATIQSTLVNSTQQVALQISNIMSFLQNCTSEQKLFEFRKENIASNGLCPIQWFLDNINKKDLVAVISNLIAQQQPITDVILNVNQPPNFASVTIDGIPILLWYLINQPLDDKTQLARIKIVMNALNTRVKNATTENNYKYLSELLKWATMNLSANYAYNCANVIKLLNTYVKNPQSMSAYANTQRFAMNQPSAANDSTREQDSPAVAKTASHN